MRLRVLFGLTILPLSLVSCATGGKFGGSGGGGEGGGAEGGGATTTAPAGGGTTTGTDTSTNSTTGMTTTTTTTPPCEESPCKLVAPQCGCEDGEMCAINTAGARTCRKPGNVAPGDVCVGLYSCQPGSLCIQSSGVSLCAPYCDDDAQCPGAAICHIQLTDPQNPGQFLPGVKLCTQDCNPITNLGCPAGAKVGCQIYTDPDAGVTFTRCVGAGVATQGQACTAIQDCAPGHSCFTLNGGAKQCLQFCNVGNPACPNCVPIDPPMTYNGVTYGACL